MQNGRVRWLFCKNYFSKKKRKLNENQFCMNVNRRENIHGLIRNITYFTDGKNNLFIYLFILFYLMLTSFHFTMK